MKNKIKKLNIQSEFRELYEIDEVIYSKNTKNTAFRPLGKYDSKELKLPKDKIKEDAPIVCGCGNKLLEIRKTDSYETSGRCLECGNQFVVHDG